MKHQNDDDPIATLAAQLDHTREQMTEMGVEIIRLRQIPQRLADLTPPDWVEPVKAGWHQCAILAAALVEGLEPVRDETDLDHINTEQDPNQ